MRSVPHVLIFTIFIFIGLSSCVAIRPGTPTTQEATGPKLRIDGLSISEIKEEALAKGRFYSDSNCWVPEGRSTCAPWFVIAGSMKCGTTSVYTYLLNHPSVLPISSEAKLNNKSILALKEIRFFNDPTFSRMVMKDEENALTEYYEIFAPIPEPGGPTSKLSNKVTGEASPMYVCQRGVSKRTFYTLPYAKVLVFLREPVDRMYSEFWFRQFLVKSNAKTPEELETYHKEMIEVFQTCANLEIVKYKYCGIDEWLKDPTTQGFDNITACFNKVNAQSVRPEFCEEHPELCVPQSIRKACMSNNVKNSIYAPQMLEWVQMYDPEQLLIVRSEDLYTNTSAIMSQVTEFLNLPAFDWDTVSDYAYNIVNPGTKSADNHVLVTDNRAGLFIGGTNAENTHNYPHLPDPIRQQLSEFFDPLNKILADITKKPIFW